MRAKLAIAIIVFLAVWIGFALRVPGHVRIERAQDINATPAQVYSYVVDFTVWPGWWPDEIGDPARVRSYTGAAASPGATYRWHGSGPAGTGEMVIVRAETDQYVIIDYTLTAPRDDHETLSFLLSAKGKATTLTIVREADISLWRRLRAPWNDPTDQRTADVETGLASIKSAVELL